MLRRLLKYYQPSYEMIYPYSCRCFASTFATFVLARVLGGLAKGNVSLATAIVTDVSTPKTRQKGMAMIG